MIGARKTDIVVVDKVRKEKMVIDMAIPGVTRVCDKEQEQMGKLQRNCQIMTIIIFINHHCLPCFFLSIYIRSNQFRVDLII